MFRIMAEPTHDIIANETFSSGMAGAVNYNRWIIDRFRPFIRGNVLEVGIGHGSFCTLLPDNNHYTGVDIDPALVDHAKTLYPQHNYYHADVIDPALPELVQRDHYDSVLCLNVLEHIENDKAALENLLAITKPDGYVLLFVPAFPGLYNSMDKLAGHHRRYTKSSFRAVIPDNATIAMLCYFNQVGGIGWWANRFSSYTSLENDAINRQIRVFDRYVVPLSRACDPVTRHIFGQSLLCALRKR